MPKEFTYRITKKKINFMTQLESEGLIRILKNRNHEEKTSIENVYSAEKHRIETDRNHAMRRIEQRIHTARLAKDAAADAKHKTRGKKDWAVHAAEYEAKRAILIETQRELSEMNTYYQGVFRDLQNKRDYNLRRLVQNYSKEYADIMSKVERKDDEEKVSYWKHKYYATKAELEKLREERAAWPTKTCNVSTS